MKIWNRWFNNLLVKSSLFYYDCGTYCFFIDDFLKDLVLVKVMKKYLILLENYSVRTHDFIAI